MWDEDEGKQKPQFQHSHPIDVMIVSESENSRFSAMEDRSRLDFPHKQISIIERRDLSKTFTLNWQTHEYAAGPPLTMKASLDITTGNSAPEPSANDWPTGTLISPEQDGHYHVY